MGVGPAAPSGRWAGPASSENEHGDDELLAAKATAFRYCIGVNRLLRVENGHHYTGMAPPTDGSADSILTLGPYPPHDAFELAATFMHEFGHNLNLDHGGSMRTTFRPHYISLMNYMWDHTYAWSEQEPDLFDPWPLDYSRSALSTLNYSALNETQPVVDESGYYTDWVSWYKPYVCFSVPTCCAIAGKGPLALRWKPFRIGTQSKIDWNRDGEFDRSVEANLSNQFPGSKPPLGGVNCGSGAGYNDWENLMYQVPESKPDGLGPGKEGPLEYSFEELEAIFASLPCLGDIDLDGVVGVSDLLVLLGSWGTCEACPADLNLDEVVGVPDLLVLLANWGLCP